MLMIPEDIAPSCPAEREGVPFAPQPGEWADLVANIQQGRQDAIERLYALFGRGVRYFLSRQLGPQDIDDKVHDTFLVVLNAIRRGDLREPDRLMGFVRTVVRRSVANHIDHIVVQRKDYTGLDENFAMPDARTDPERDTLRRQRISIMKQVLRSISRRDREILTRFYLHEQTQEEICHEMGLNDTQYRLLKSRAKARFAELGRRKLETPNTSANKKVRTTAGD
jgi:RNA polymerase sigma factor (sigma-70 family)